MLILVGAFAVPGAMLAWSASLHPEFRLENLARLRLWVEEQGSWAPILYILGYVLLELAFVPALPLSIVGGVAFGSLWGTVYVLVGATGAAALAFLLARHGARGLVARWVAAWPRIAHGPRSNLGIRGWSCLERRVLWTSPDQPERTHVLGLFNTRTDPGERHNLVNERPALAAELERALLTYLAKVEGKTYRPVLSRLPIGH